MLHHKNPSDTVVKAACDLSKRLYRQQASLVVCHAKDTGSVLVVRRFKDNQVGLPCGKVDAGENVRDAAFRELYEETGVHVNQLAEPLVFMQSVLFEGTQVNVFTTATDRELITVAAPGFEGETSPFWLSPDDLAKEESRFQSFNILALFNAGLIK